MAPASATRRRVVLGFGLGVGSTLAPFVHAQTAPAKVWRIGILSPVPTAFMARGVEALRLALRERGYVEGRNLVIDFKSAEGHEERVAPLAAEFVRQNVDLIVTHGLAPIEVKKATSTIPIVVTDSGDLVAMGVVESLARPGGNVTGQVFFVGEIAAKRVELLKEALPRLTQVGVMYVESRAANTRPGALLARAAQLKLKAPLFEVAPGETDFGPVFAAIARQQVKAMTFADHPTFISASRAIAQEAFKHRVATAGGPLFAESGGMLGYGVRFPELWASAAIFIDKIFKGAKPADLPIMQPTRFHLVVNQLTAQAIGVQLPQPFVQRADLVVS